MTLKHLLEMFKHSATNERILYLDIKDYGFEAAHLEAVRDLDLENHVAFVSWVPQTLLTLHELGTTAPLILSHVNLFKYGVGGRFLSGCLKNSMFRLSDHVVLGGGRADSSPGELAAGFHYNMICTALPDSLVPVLAAGGGICISYRFLSSRLVAYCGENGLKLLVYSV